MVSLRQRDPLERALPDEAGPNEETLLRGEHNEARMLDWLLLLECVHYSIFLSLLERLSATAVK